MLYYYYSHSWLKMYFYYYFYYFCSWMTTCFLLFYDIFIELIFNRNIVYLSSSFSLIRIAYLEFLLKCSLSISPSGANILVKKPFIVKGFFLVSFFFFFSFSLHLTINRGLHIVYFLYYSPRFSLSEVSVVSRRSFSSFSNIL